MVIKIISTSKNLAMDKVRILVEYYTGKKTIVRDQKQPNILEINNGINTDLDILSRMGIIVEKIPEK